MKVITCIAPVNIAVIKYWGKRNEELILPINDSISSTLSLDYMCAKTTIMASPNFKDNKFWLNGKEESFENKRLLNCLKEKNNFPTAAGLASSAAGYACLVSALAALYGIEGDISAIARRGSGSACRSIYGGWVQWHMGENEDGSDSIATQIATAAHWPEIRILVLVVNDSRKKYSSTSGMMCSVATSELLKYRAEEIVPKRTQAMLTAIKSRDFPAFAKLTMRDSNQFHCVCLDTYPPCVYMNDVSHAIAEVVHAYNDAKGAVEVAYTFDAGPNACLYTRESQVGQLAAVINKLFPSTTDPSDYVKGIPIKLESLSEDLKSINIQKQETNALKYIIHTKVGDGPKVLEDPSHHLLDNRGQPLLK